jgi:carboxylesterase
VLCGAPFLLTDSRLRWLPLVARFRGAEWRARLLPKPNGPDIADPAMRAASQSYRAMPLAAVLELLRLRAVVRAELGRVRQPTLQHHGRNDHSVPVTNLELLRQKLGSRDIETHVLERSWHVVTVDYDREEVARLAVAFLDRVEAAPGD